MPFPKAADKIELEDYPALNDVAANFKLYSDVATEGNSSHAPQLVSSLNSIASKVQSAITNVKLNPLADRGAAMTQIADVTKAEIDKAVEKVTRPLEADIASETKSLWNVKESPRAREIRDNFSSLLGDPVALVPEELSDEVFYALSVAPERPVSSVDDAGNPQVSLEKFFDSETTEKELLRRRPDTAARISAFTNRRDTAFGMGKVLAKEVAAATYTQTGWEKGMSRRMLNLG